jgi:hypothetical protein
VAFRVKLSPPADSSELVLGFFGPAVTTGEYLGRVPRGNALTGGLPSRSSRAPSPSKLLSSDKSARVYCFLVVEDGCRDSPIA